MQTHESLLSPRRFTSAISNDPEFLGALPKIDFRNLDPAERRAHQQRAIARGALSISRRLEHEKGEHDLDAHLYKLVGKLDSFYSGSRAIDELRNRYGTPRSMPPNVRQEFYHKKEDVTEFNHTLHEVMNVGARPLGKTGFNDLLGFMTKMHVAAHGRETADDFYKKARETIIGIRNEMGTEQVLIAGGVDYEIDPEMDRFGGDITVNNVPIDVKASPTSAKHAQEKARLEGRNPDTIIWSHINFEDFEGRLDLPRDTATAIFSKLKPDLDKAVRSHHTQLAGV